MKVVAITGGAQGIGRAIALRFARAGYAVSIADPDADAGREAAGLVEKEGARSLFVPADSGSVSYAGRDLTRMSDVERSALRRTEFGFIFQFGQLVPELTCLENVALPLRLGGVRRRAAERTARSWLHQLEVEDVAGKLPGTISGGQGQRVAVARSLVTGPRVVFADEPTGALDSLNGEKVMLLLTKAARETGAAIVLVTHEARVAAYADREVVVRDGVVHDHSTSERVA